MGNYLIGRLQQVEGLQNVRGRGLMIGFDVPEACKNLRSMLLNDYKIFTGEAKPNVVRLLPSLAITKKECDLFLAALQDAMNKLQQDTRNLSAAHN